jgi:hypothetical protein
MDQLILVAIVSASLGSLVPMFWKKVIGTKYLTLTELKANVCTSCNKDLEKLREDVLHATTEDRRTEMKQLKDDMNDKLSKIMGIMLVLALKEEGRALTADERQEIIKMATGQKG